MNNYDKDVGALSLFDFFDRYLAGSSCLEQSRNVSRRQIALGKTKGVSDQNTAKLMADISLYQKTVLFLVSSTKFDVDCLTKAHETLLPHNEFSGQLRKHPSFVRIDSKGTTIRHVSPEHIRENLAAIFEYIKNSNHSDTDKAINIYFKLLHTHPFRDGNGRLARAIVQSFLVRAGYFNMHPCLFRFQCSPEIYFSSAKTSVDKEFKHHEELFYSQAKSWSEAACVRAKQLLESTQKQLFQKLGLGNFNRYEKNFIDELWAAPVIWGEDSLEKSSRKEDKKQTIIRFMELGILKPQRLSISNRMIFICEEILDCWDSLDNLLMKFKI